MGYDFLKINGWDLPILECGKSINELGSRGQAFDGLPLATRQGIKRKWKCKTGLLSYDEAKAFEHLLTNGGDSWQFNQDLFSTKGMRAEFARNSPAYLPNGGVVGTGQPRFVDGGVLVEEGTTNLLSPNQTSVENELTTIIQGTGGTGTLTRSVEQAYHGTASAKLIKNGAYIFSRHYSGAVSGGMTYTFSAWVYVVEHTKINTIIRPNVSPFYLPCLYTVPANQWTRIVRKITFDSAVVNVAIDIGWENLDAPDGTICYIDAVQFEQKPYPTSFTIGTRINERLSLPTQILNPKEFTIDVTVKPKNIDFANRSMPFVSNWNNWREGNQRGFALRCFNNNWYPDFNVCNGVGYYTIKSNTPIPWDKESKIRAVLKAGEIFAIYVNGAKTTGIPPAQCVLDDGSPIELGYTGVNLGYFNGIMRDFAIYNVALPDAATVSNTTGTVFLSVSGDAIGTNTQCIAEINNIDYVRGTRRQQIDFTLTEA